MAQEYPVVIIGHTDDDKKKNLMIESIKSFKSKGHYVIVSDHIFNREVFEYCDQYVISEDNPIWTKKDYLRVGLNHTSHKINTIKKYNTFTPYGTFAAYSIIELIKKGYEKVEGGGALVVNYDFQLVKDIKFLYREDFDATFLRYSDYDAVYTSVFFIKDKLVNKLNDCNSLEDYAKNLKYLEWWFYDLYKDDNINIRTEHHSNWFKGDLYYRSNNLPYDFNIWKFEGEDKVLFRYNNIYEEHPVQDSYDFVIDGKKITYHLDDLHFKLHKASRIT